MNFCPNTSITSLWPTLCSILFILSCDRSQGSAPINILGQACKDTGVNSTKLLDGVHLRVGFYAGELSECDAMNHPSICARFGTVHASQNKQARIWTGPIIAEWYLFASEGNFTFEIVSLGMASNITAYTELARQFLGLSSGGPEHPVDILGDPTWKVTSDRASDMLWSVSTVSSDVQFLTRPPQIADDSVRDNATLLLQPFTIEVWGVLAILTIAAMLVFGFIARHTNADTDTEVSYEELVCSTFVTFVGNFNIDTHPRRVNAFAVLWVLFVLMMAHLYLASLTAILAMPGVVDYGLTGISDAIKHKARFCVQEGTANEEMFKNDPDYNKHNGLQLVSVSTVRDQIEGIIDGTCDAADITREDYNMWARDQAVSESQYCGVALAGQVCAASIVHPLIKHTHIRKPMGKHPSCLSNTMFVEPIKRCVGRRTARTENRQINLF
eukprot:m.908364 g.908364  ORF g.908364 m.908364 type:complete len:442 (-) comp23712_c0_seq53:910-2235(-)